MNGVDRVKVRFDRTHARGEAALMPFFVCGFPSVRATREAIWEAYEAGSSMIELGIPFSDPVADGPAIQRASLHAIERGMTPKKALAFVDGLRREGLEVPILGMTYANLVFASGVEKTFHAWAAAGFDGAIIPDVSLPDEPRFEAALADAGLATVGFASPSSSDRRIRAAMKASSGFLYLVGVYGTTGARARIAPETREVLRRARALRNGARPAISVGFGISRPTHVRGLRREGADGVIVGSALVELLERQGNVRRYLKGLKAATLGRPPATIR